jgi:uncharacterized protein (DUF58 family)
MAWRYLDAALVEQLNQLELSARTIVEGAAIGQHRSPARGGSIDFRQHRAYAAGDEPRRLDWRVLARTERPFIKEYDQETNLRCMLLLDVSGSMAYGRRWGTKSEAAAKLAAALAYLMLRQTESVGVALCGRRIQRWVGPAAGPRQLSTIIDQLERSSAEGESGIAACMHEAAERIERRALVVVVSDFFTDIDALRKAMAHLRHERHEVLMLQVLDPDEVEFPFSEWARFRGLEGEAPLLIQPAALREVYRGNFLAHQEALQAACRKLHVQQETYRSDLPLLEWLTHFLRRRTANVNPATSASSSSRAGKSR